MTGPTEDEFRGRADLQEGVSGLSPMMTDNPSNDPMCEVRRPRSASTDTPAPDDHPGHYYGIADYDL